VSAEAIAKVCSDLWAGRFNDQFKALDAPGEARLLLGAATVIDSTALYHSLVDTPRPYDIYADHRIAPPWLTALVCYRNEHGNVIATHVTATPADKITARWESDAETHSIDWPRVAWVLMATVYMGGHSHGEPFPTTGPVHAWYAAVYETGEIADLRWVHIAEQYPMSRWDMASLVWLGTLNFLNCRNVQLVEPSRPRAVARRVARTGVRVHELTVTPLGRSTRREDGREPVPTAMPLHSVRGHFANYGVDGRGLLFGKLAGRYWIPQHARGRAEHGVVDQRFTVQP
jgi:hypothetical protein